MERIYEAFDRAAEAAMLADASIDAAWALIERFSTLVRESGSEDERKAAQYISEQLSNWGVPHTVYEPELYLSVPRSASVEVAAQGRTLRAKTPSFSASTGEAGLTGQVVYVPAEMAAGVGEIFDKTADRRVDVAGKIVLTHGYAMPGSVLDLERRGAIGQIYINPGKDIHWGICTTIWGTPDLDNIDRKPRTPVVAVNSPDGLWLRDLARNGELTVTLRTELWEGWAKCPLIVAEIKGTEEPERFILVHGHYDSWAVGIGDNAVGNGTLLELARIFWKHRDKLRRSVRIAWWPGHSTGRYA
ncbi:MAG TPA: M28 family peptidase, partial [Caldilineae bacterium]|nr:M28 family peptidase [Caldilineae bacterium]